MFPLPKLQSRVAVIDIDRRSTKTGELSEYPFDLLRPVWGRVIDLAFSSGPQVVAFDIVFARDLSPVHGVEGGIYNNCSISGIRTQTIAEGETNPFATTANTNTGQLNGQGGHRPRLVLPPLGHLR